MRLASLAHPILALMAMSGIAAGQQFPFQLRYSQGDNAGSFSNGGTLGFSAELGQSQAARLVATYRGAGRASITQPLELFGSGAFTVTASPSPPLSLNPGDSVSLDVQFRPTVTTLTVAELSLAYTETILSATSSASSSGTISVGLQGGAPSMVLNYILQTDLNVVPLAPGGSIVFPPTQVGASSTANFVVTNRGSGPGVVKGVSIQGAAFRLSGLPLFPVTIAAGQELRLPLTYSPQSIQDDSGAIQVTLGDDRVVTVNLSGSGAGSSFTYELVNGTSVSAITSNEPASLPDIAVGETGSVVIRVRNTGNSNGVISSILLLGAGFQIVSLPPLPVSLAPQASLAFTVTFQPPQAGTFHGQLRIGESSFDLAGRGIGARLVFSYVSGDSTVAVNSGGSVIFSPTTIGQTQKLDFSVKNMGTLAANVANVGVVDARSPFAVSGLPPLPASLAPDGEMRFTIAFAPLASGFSNAVLRIDSATLTLTGSATPPPALPSYRIDGPGDTVDPVSQPAFGLTLSAPYSLALSGTLTVSGDVSLDPAVQFSSGGRSASFTIPANTTRAIFSNQSNQIRLQTGTVAGTLLLTPSFAIEPGGADITPDSPSAQRVTIAAGAPKLQALRIDSRTTTGFTLLVTGYSTTRTLADLILAFTAAPGFNLANSQITFHLAGDAALWFQSATSQALGGQFTAAIPFTFRSDNGSSSPIDALKSVSVTATNERGTSNALQADIN